MTPVMEAVFTTLATGFQAKIKRGIAPKTGMERELQELLDELELHAK